MGRLRPLRGIRRLVRSLRRHLGAVREGPRADRGYLICSSPRCGSTYLCELLAGTGVLGVPREYMNVAGKWGRLDREHPTDLRALLDRVLRAGATPNGIYALKVHADHFAAIAAVIDPLSILPDLKFVRIRRRDILAQAISFLRARQTYRFRAAEAEKRVPTYDAAGIRQCLELLAGQNATWERLFGATGRVPLDIEYEGLMRNPQRDVDRVAQFMGLATPVPIAPERVRVSILRDRLNEDWRNRFLAETGDEFGHLAGAAMPRSMPGSASAS